MLPLKLHPFEVRSPENKMLARFSNIACAVDTARYLKTQTKGETICTIVDHSSGAQYHLHLDSSTLTALYFESQRANAAMLRKGTY